MGKIAAKILASGHGWNATDLVCTAGPRDHPFEEQHGAWSISVVIQGSFQYRSSAGTAVMSPGALLLGQGGHSFECAHAYGMGDHCLSFHYMPEFLDECGVASFLIPSLSPLPGLSPLTVIAALGVQSPERVSFDELAASLACAVGEVVNSHRKAAFTPAAADERRVSAVLRFIEAHAGEPLPLGLLASTAKMSLYHFLRTFRGVTGLTPHQYILRMRLRQAAARLTSGQARILDLALACGFADLSNFNRAFRTEFGLSPRAYRSRHSLEGGAASLK